MSNAVLGRVLFQFQLTEITMEAESVCNCVGHGLHWLVVKNYEWISISRLHEFAKMKIALRPRMNISNQIMCTIPMEDVTANLWLQTIANQYNWRVQLCKFELGDEYRVVDWPSTECRNRYNRCKGNVREGPNANIPTCNCTDMYNLQSTIEILVCEFTCVVRRPV